MHSEEERFRETQEDDFMWCLNCERAYSDEPPRVIFEEDDFFELCPFEDCDGSILLHSKDWEWVRSCRPEYPERPESGSVYPLYPDKRQGSQNSD
jgi:hypothetical protein